MCIAATQSVPKKAMAPSFINLGKKKRNIWVKCNAAKKKKLLHKHLEKETNNEKDINAVTTPVAAPIAKDPLNIPRKIPMDLNIAVTSNVWLLSPAG